MSGVAISTVANSAPPAASLVEMIEAKRLLEARQASEWVLMAPNGETWIASPAELIAVLARHHPLMKGLL